MHLQSTCLLLAAGEYEKGKKRVWMIARQHPGESMAEWFVEGKYCSTDNVVSDIHHSVLFLSSCSASIKLLSTSLPDKPRLAPHALSLGWQAVQLLILSLQHTCFTACCGPPVHLSYPRSLDITTLLHLCNLYSNGCVS